jgi:hypothetical protein
MVNSMARLTGGTLRVQCPAIGAVHAVLDRHGLVTRREAPPVSPRRDDALSTDPAQRPVVRGLQGRVHETADTCGLVCSGLSLIRSRHSFLRQ